MSDTKSYRLPTFNVKYALSKSIIEYPGYLETLYRGNKPFLSVPVKGWCETIDTMIVSHKNLAWTREQAVIKAQEMARNKIKNLRKQIKRLEEIAAGDVTITAADLPAEGVEALVCRPGHKQHLAYILGGPVPEDSLPDYD